MTNPQNPVPPMSYQAVQPQGNSSQSQSGTGNYTQAVQPQGNSSQSQLPAAKKTRQKGRWSLPKSIKAYGGSLLITSISFPIFATGVTVCFYLAPHIKFPLFYLEHVTSNWYAPVYGLITSLLALFIFSLLRIRFATASGANMNVYELLKNRHAELRARLGNIDVSNYTNTEATTDQAEYKNHMDIIQRLFTVEASDSYRQEALRKVYEAYRNLSYSLFHTEASVEWVLGTGYAHAWRVIHQAQEALIEVEATQEVIGDVIHDVRSIKGSAISDNTALVYKMLLAMKDISPEAIEYFDELRVDKNYADLFTLPDPAKPAQPPRSNEMAREAIRQVKHTLNLYQDTLREALVRIRNRILISIAFTGFITYFLLCILILLNASTAAISAATAYYMLGTIAGLFVRFYNESNNKEAPEDYGLFLSRLLATPLLSGLAGIGGVLITATISTLGGSGASLSLDTIFKYPPNLDYLIAAAIFGYAPNLIIGTLQQRAQKYSTDLQNSKGEGTSKDE